MVFTEHSWARIESDSLYNAKG